MTSAGTTRYQGQIVDLFAQRTYPGFIEVTDGKISAVQEDPTVTESSYT
jgi:adenine deaminase